jgi:hypothetical protein
MLCEIMIAVCCEYHRKHTNTCQGACYSCTPERYEELCLGTHCGKQRNVNRAVCHFSGDTVILKIANTSIRYSRSQHTLMFRLLKYYCSLINREHSNILWDSLLTLTNTYGSHRCFFFFFNFYSGGWSPDLVHSARRPFLAYCTCPGWLWGWRIWWNKDWQEKSKYAEKTWPIATLSTANPIWPVLDENPGRRGGKPTTKRLSYGAACYQKYSWGVRGGWSVRLKTLPPSASRLSKETLGASTSQNPMGLHGLLQE